MPDPNLDLENLFNVRGQVAILTGGGGNLCSTMARALAWAGVKVALADLRAEACDPVVETIRQEGGEAMGVGCDVTDPESIAAMHRQVVDAFGTVDILVNGAGGNNPKATATPDLSFFDLDPAAIRQVMDLNFLGTVLPCREVGRAMGERGRGCIINISSMAADRPLTRVVSYAAAKAAVSNFTKWLAVYMAQEFNPAIRVNAIAPGFFLTNQNRFLLIDKESGSLTDRGKTIISQTPAKRFGEARELLGTVLWLASPASAFVTGTVVPIDGGFSAFSGV